MGRSCSTSPHDQAGDAEPDRNPEQQTDVGRGLVVHPVDTGWGGARKAAWMRHGALDSLAPLQSCGPRGEGGGEDPRAPLPRYADWIIAARGTDSGQKLRRKLRKRRGRSWALL